MTQPIATIHINTSYTTPRIGRQYARNLAEAMAQEFPDWQVQIIPGAKDWVTVPIENELENFRTEIQVRDLMTAALTQAVDDCRENLDGVS